MFAVAVGWGVGLPGSIGLNESRVGDVISVDSVTGTVENIGFRSTRIRTTDRTFVAIPNRKIVDSNLNNLSLRTGRKVTVTLGLSF